MSNADIDIESDEPIYERPSEIPKNELYQLLFDEWLNYKEVAALCETGRGIQVATVCRLRGVPIVDHGYGNTEANYVFRRRPKSMLYEQYWVEGLSQRKLAERHNISHKEVARRLRDESIPVDSSTDFSRERFYDNGTPKGFGYEPSDDGDDEMPDDPDGSKYLADYPEYDADWLYEMHWGYGLSIKEIVARTETKTHHQALIDEFEKRGIPHRRRNDHYQWEPHKGVPPKYEWTDGDPTSDDSDVTVDADDYDNDNDFKVASWRSGLEAE